VSNNNVGVERPGVAASDAVDVSLVDDLDRSMRPDSTRLDHSMQLGSKPFDSMQLGSMQLSAFYPSEGTKAAGGLPPAPGAPHPASALGGLRVLVVEDDPDARELVSAILEDAGAVVESAPSAATGFAAIRTFHPQLLVSDIGMPDEDGYSLIRRIRALADADGGSIPSIALTAYTRPEDRAKALGAGFTLHMGKPISPVALVSAIRHLASREPRN
jgi:CheY-like chemotaxis protein